MSGQIRIVLKKRSHKRAVFYQGPRDDNPISSIEGTSRTVKRLASDYSNEYSNELNEEDQGVSNLGLAGMNT